MKLLILLSIFLMLSGIIGTGITYRDMATENLLHAKTGIITLKLSDTSDWQLEKFALYQGGNHLLVLTTVNNFSKPYRGDSAEQLSPQYKGQLDVEVLKPLGETLLSKHFTGNSLSLNVPYNMWWTVLDTLHIGEAFEGTWNIKARVSAADTSFSRTTSQVFILPPQRYDIGWYLYGKVFQLVGFGLLIIVGFILLFISGCYCKRAKEKHVAN